MQTYYMQLATNYVFRGNPDIIYGTINLQILVECGVLTGILNERYAMIIMEQVLERAEGQQEEKAEKKKLLIAKGRDGFRISLEGNRKIWSVGDTPEDALLNLAERYQVALGFEIHLDGQEPTSRKREIGEQEPKKIHIVRRGNEFCATLNSDGHSVALACGQDLRGAIINMFSSPIFQKETGIEVVHQR